MSFTQSLTNLTKWSNLASVGTSNVGRVTILMPFIGYLILFNPSFLEFFQQQIPGSLDNAPVWVNQLHSNRLAFLYFGLLAIGFGILLYVAFSPEQLRLFPSVSDYVFEMEKISSPALVHSKFDDVMSRFMQINSGERMHPVFGEQHPSFPIQPSELLHLLIARLFRNIDEGLISPDNFHNDPEGTMIENSPYIFHTGSGHILTDNILRVMYSGRTVDRILLQEMKNEVQVHRKELFYLEHLSLNFSHFLIRIVVSVLFLLGFILLLIPTLSTSILVFFATF